LDSRIFLPKKSYAQLLLQGKLEKAFDEIKGISEDSEFHLENEKAQVEGQKAEINKLKKNLNN